MAYSDITKTGPQTYRDLQNQNNPTFEEDNNDLGKIGKSAIQNARLSPKKSLEEVIDYKHSQYKDPVQWAQELREAGYGESKYDALISPDNLDMLQENRALNQSGWEQLLNGVLKGAITTGTTFVNTLAGLPLGALEALGTGNVSKIWDNEITNAMQDIDEWAERELPNYYSQEELDNPWYQNIFTTNFLGDKLIKNFGFTFGAGAAGKVISKMPKLLPRLLTKAATAAGKAEKDVAAIGRAANAFGTSFVSAVGEGSIEALQATKEWSTEMSNMINGQYQDELMAIQSKYQGIARDAFLEYGNTPETQAILSSLESDMQKEMYAAENKKNQNMAQVAAQRAQTGNAVLGFNLPILTMGNLLTLGKVYAKGYTAEMSSISDHIKFHPEDLANAGKTVKETSRRLTWKGIRDVEKEVPKEAFTSNVSVGRNVAKTLASAGWEGTEEMLQAWVSNASKDYNTDYYNQSVDPEYTDKTASMWKSLGDSFVETVGNIDNWEEFAIGMLSGGISNMILGQTGEMSRERKAVNEAVANLNNAVNTFNNREMIKGINRHQYLEDLKTSAAIEHREKEYKDADFAQLASDVVLFGSLGKLDELKAVVDYNLTNLSDSELEQLSQELSQKEVNGPENNYFAKLDLAGKRKYLKDQQDKYHKVIDDYNNEYNELTALTGNLFSQEQMSELVYERLRTKNSSERADEVKQQLKEQINQSLEQTKTNRDYRTTALRLQKNILSGLRLQLTNWNRELNELKKQKDNLSTNLHSSALFENYQRDIISLEKTIEKYQKVLSEYENAEANTKNIRSRAKKEQSEIKLLQKLLNTDDSNIEGYNSALEFIAKNLDTIFDVNSKKLYAGNVREAAMATLGLGMVLGSISTDSITSQKLMSGVMDITTLLADAMNYNNRVSEFLNNPQKLEEKNNGIRERVEAKRIERQTNKVIEDIANTEDFNEFNRKLNTLDPKVKARVLEKLKDRQNRNALEYDSKSRKINLVLDYINKSDAELNIKQAALTIFNEASRLLPEESLFNIDARIYSREANQQLDDDTYVKTKTLLAQAFKFQEKENSEPKQTDTINAEEAPTTNEKKEAKTKDDDSITIEEMLDENQRDIDEKLSDLRGVNQEEERQGTGSSFDLNLSSENTQQTPESAETHTLKENTNREEVKPINVPNNNLTTENPTIDTTVTPEKPVQQLVVTPKTEAVMGMQEYDTKAGSTNKGNRPIDEKDASGNLTKQAKNSTILYNKLKELGAFDNVDNGVVKQGSRVYFGLLPALDQQIEAETGYKGTTILMFVDGKCVGHLVNSREDSVGKQLGIENLLKEEFKKELANNPNTNDILISKKYFTIVDELWTGSVFYNGQEYHNLTNEDLQWVKDRINSSTTSEEDRTPLITIFDGSTKFRKGNTEYNYGMEVATVYMDNPLYKGAPVILVPSGAYDRNKPNTQQSQKAFVPVALRRTLFNQLREDTTTYRDIFATINELFEGGKTVKDINRIIGNLKKNITYEFNSNEGKQQVFIVPARQVIRDDGQAAIVEMTPQMFDRASTKFEDAQVTHLIIQRKVGGKLQSSYTLGIAQGSFIQSAPMSEELQYANKEALLNFLKGEANAFVNIDQSRLNDPKYVQQIIDDELLQTNARELRVVANSFHMVKEVREDDGTQQTPTVQTEQQAQPTETTTEQTMVEQPTTTTPTNPLDALLGNNFDATQQADTEGIDDTNKYSRVTEETETGTIDIDKEVNNIMRMLPQLDKETAFQIVNDFIKVNDQGDNAQGIFNRGIITLSKLAESGTAYHEAFHLVFNMLLTEDEKLALMNEYKDNYPNSSDVDLEEQMADDFKEYALLKENNRSTSFFNRLGKKVLNAFNRILNFLHLKKNNPTVFQTVAANIWQGKYANREVTQTTENNSKYSLPLATRIANAGLTRKEYNKIRKVVDAINDKYSKQKKYNGFAIQFATKNGETAFFLTYNSGVVWDNGVKTAVYRPEISEKFVEKYLKDNHLNSYFELVKTNMGDIKLVAKHDLDNIGEETPYETYQRLSAWSREQYTLSPEEDYFIQSYDNKFNTEEVCG